MRKRLWTTTGVVIAILLVGFPSYAAKALLWITAAEHWYPPVQNGEDPQGFLTIIISAGALIYLVGGVLVLIVHVIFGRIGLFTWLDGAESWRADYSSLKAAFTPLIAKAAGVSEDRAREMISEMFSIPEGEHLVAFTRDPMTREALRAWVVLAGLRPRIPRLHLFAWDADSRDGRKARDLRARLWEETLALADARNDGKVRWIIEVNTPSGMVSNTVQAIDLYLSQRGYPHLVTPPVGGRTRHQGMARMARKDEPWSESESGQNIVAILYTDPMEDTKRADDEITTLTLICAAAPLARIPLATSGNQLQEAKQQVEHLAELLALRGFAPPEFRNDPQFNGIVDAATLAQWAIREVVLDTEPERIMEGR